jgi:N-acetylneuraminic acid mutarotase
MKAGAIDNVIYVVGGDPDLGPTRALPNVDAYDVATNTWSSRQPLPSARSDINGASVIAGRVYVTGGIRPVTGGGFTLTRILFVYSRGTNRWTKKTDMPLQSAGGVQGVIDGRLYVYVPGSSTVVSVKGKFLRYNPATDTWVTLPAPPVMHRHGAGGVINGRFHLVGGDDGALATTGILNVYNPSTNKWTTKAPMAWRESGRRLEW